MLKKFCKGIKKTIILIIYNKILRFGYGWGKPILFTRKGAVKIIVINIIILINILAPKAAPKQCSLLLLLVICTLEEILIPNQPILSASDKKHYIARNFIEPAGLKHKFFRSGGVLVFSVAGSLLHICLRKALKHFGMATAHIICVEM